MKRKHDAVSAFVQEARELLAAMETVLLQMAFIGVDKAGIDAVFRSMHTIKGSASIFEFEQVVSFTHMTENVLDKVRNSTLILDDVMRVLLLECNDYVSSQIDAIENSKEEQPIDLQRRIFLEDKLSAYLGSGRNVFKKESTTHLDRSEREKSKKKPKRNLARQITGFFSKSPDWYLSLRFDRKIFTYGLSPITFIRHLCKLGSVIDIHVIDERLPISKKMDPEYCYIGFEILFHSEATKDEIIAVFDLLSDDSNIVVIAPFSDIDAYRDVLANFKKPEDCLALLKRMLSFDQEECALLVNTGKDQEQPLANGMSAELIVGSHIKTEKLPVLATAQRDISDNQFIKIEVEKLEQLIDLVGELVIAGATASLVAKIKRDYRFQEMTQTISELVEKIRDTALTFRMVKINEVFQRFPRVIRETARELGKEVDLVITGEETELDKSMMEKISNPLMHLVRNAIDHGIEPTDERVACGKEKKGKINMRARHESGSVVIEIIDDGRGINQQKVLSKAIEKGFVQDGEVLTKNEILNFIFSPGFSTAEKITAISGRGVGMDVVKRNIDQLHGKITIDSIQGQGTTMHIRLPLTLAIISGFQVIVGDMVFVLPLDLVVECINLTSYPANNNIVTLRGEPLSFINMRSLFDMPLRNMPRQNMLIVQYAEYRIGLLVDELQGECQAVVKPLNTLFAKMKGLSGSTILGDGRIALILDVAHLVEYVKQCEKTELEATEQRSR